MLTSFLDNRLIVAVRHHAGRFGVRLALGLVLALVVAQGLTYGVVSKSLASEQTQAATALHRADAASLVVALNMYPKRTDYLREIDERLRVVADRSGALEAILVDQHFRVVAGGDDTILGRLERSPRVIAAMRTGAVWAGHESDRQRPHQDFENITPITIRGARYVFESATDGGVLASRLASIRRELLIVGGIALLSAGLLFWLTGGRRVLSMHRFALERATRDGLTDLLNHRAFQEALTRAGDAAARYGDRVALLLLDIDSFKSENDRHGHRHGDDRLKLVAHTIATGRSGDLAFRVGGDEFALLLTHADAEGASRVAARVRAQLAEQQILVSIGVGVLRAGQSPADLREEVDAALYEAKRTGGDRAVPFEDISDSISVMTETRRNAFSELIATSALTVVFQPIWDLPNDRLLAVEALARPRGFPGPAAAFDAAYQLGRVHELDQLCVDRILARAPELADGVLLFVNLSPKTLELDAEGSHWFVEAVADAGVDPARVVIEVTERMGSRTNAVTKSISHLREHGFRIALDDVGSGNSGLEMLRRLQPDYVKLDRTVVVGALEDPHARGILMAVSAFAHETGAFVIAEGIEDDEVLDFVNGLRARDISPSIDGGQGFGLGRPDSRLPTTDSVPRQSLPGSADSTVLAVS